MISFGFFVNRTLACWLPKKTPICPTDYIIFSIFNFFTDKVGFKGTADESITLLGIDTSRVFILMP